MNLNYLVPLHAILKKPIKKSMKQLLLFLTTLCCGSLSAQNLVINEIMQSNVETIMDDIKEFPDSWVELYNPTDAAINLQDYKIGTKDKESKACTCIR